MSVEVVSSFPHILAGVLFPGCRFTVDEILRGARASLCRGDRIVGQFSLTHLPGNRACVVLHGMWLDKGYRGRGWGNRLHSLVVPWVLALQAVRLECTVLESNHVQHRCLRRAGWVRGRIYFNPRNRHVFAEWGLVLNVVSVSDKTGRARISCPVVGSVQGVVIFNPA